MNISSSVNLGQLSSTDRQGAAARQDYGVAVAAKIKESIQQEGVAIVKLAESAAVDTSNETTGKNLSTYA